MPRRLLLHNRSTTEFRIITPNSDSSTDVFRQKGFISNKTHILIECAKSTEVTVPKRRISKLTISAACGGDPPNLWYIDIPSKSKRPTGDVQCHWRVLSAKPHDVGTTETFPWRVYYYMVSESDSGLLFLPFRELESFLRALPDDTLLCDIVLPGTHNTVAVHGFPISQCQNPSFSLPIQLHSGIRFLDIRLSVYNRILTAFHGILNQHMPFSTIIADITTFLHSEAGESEVLIMSIKQEDFGYTPAQVFSGMVKESIAQSRNIWWLEDRIPSLGEVRGKVILFRRFEVGFGEVWENGAGIEPTIWPDNLKESFEWYCRDTKVVTQDWYAIPSFLSIPEKFSASISPLTSSTSSTSSDASPTLPISFTSASKFPFALPPIVARGLGWPRWGFGIEGVNVRIGRWLLDLLEPCGEASTDHGSSMISEKRAFHLQDERLMKGWVLMDYIDQPEGIPALLIEMNFR